MTAVYDVLALLLDRVQRPLPAGLLAFLPLMIAIAGAASLMARSDDRIRAIVQIITGGALSIWMLLPWHPADPAMIAMNRIVTLFAFGYVLQDWLREVWRAHLNPVWAHGLVIAWTAACGLALILAPTPA